mgnify:CR=1 FL=1
MDPGEIRKPSPNYILAKGKVHCLVHGAIRGPNDAHGLTPYEELKAFGVTNNDLLSRAAKKHKSSGWGPFVINPFFDAMVLSFLWILIRLISSAGRFARSQYDYVMYGKVAD